MSLFSYFISINYCTIQTQNYKNEVGCKKVIQVLPFAFPCSFAYKVVCVDNKYSKKLICTK